MNLLLVLLNTYDGISEVKIEMKIKKSYQEARCLVTVKRKVMKILYNKRKNDEILILGNLTLLIASSLKEIYNYILSDYVIYRYIGPTHEDLYIFIYRGIYPF